MFDRFWDQLVVNLAASGTNAPGMDYRFHSNLSNLVLGEKLHFSLRCREREKTPRRAVVRILSGSRKITEVELLSEPGEMILKGSYVPPQVGNFRAEIDLPDGSSQQAKFIVFRQDNETSEVSADVTYLRRLTKSANGAVIDAAELKKLLVTFSQKPRASGDDQIRLVPIWDTAGFFYLVCLFFGVDWLLRRRWGLA